MNKSISVILATIALINISPTFHAPAAFGQDAPIDVFRAELERQDKELEKFNLDFYEDVELIEEKTAKLTVTDQWMQTITPEDPTGNLQTLFDSWVISHGSSGSDVKLIIVGPGGEVIREMVN